MVWTVMHTAARDGDMKRMRRCIEEIKWLDKTDVNAQTEARGHTPLHMCAANGHTEVMQYIINVKGANVNIHTKAGNTPLHLAAQNSKDAACKMLLNNGAIANVQNGRGQTAADVCTLPSLQAFLAAEVAEASKKKAYRKMDSSMSSSMGSEMDVEEV